MSTIKNALLLVGSPKAKRSSSEALGSYLLEGLREKGVVTEKLHLNRMLQMAHGEKQLLEAVNNCDLLILAFPLYVDCLPAGTIKALEVIARQRGQKGSGAEEAHQQSLLAICQSGFPEAHQNNTALAICRCFAGESGFNWVGGLALGGGGAINGQPLEKLGAMMGKVRKALELTAEALTKGQPVPEQAVQLMGKPLTPNWLYILAGNRMWKMQAKKFGVAQQLNDRPDELR